MYSSDWCKLCQANQERALSCLIQICSGSRDGLPINDWLWVLYKNMTEDKWTMVKVKLKPPKKSHIQEMKYVVYAIVY